MEALLRVAEDPANQIPQRQFAIGYAAAILSDAGIVDLDQTALKQNKTSLNC